MAYQPLVPTLQAKLVASDGAYGANFGYAVALEGDTALIGAHGSQAAYVFTRQGGTWAEQAKLVAADPPSVTSYFGLVVALSGDTAVIGAADAAYVFTRHDGVWAEQQRLAGVPGDQFGYSVAVVGDTAFIGAPGASAGMGAVHVFSRSGGVWTEQAKLSNPSTTSFGYKMAASDQALVVGASYGAYAFTPSGGAWVTAGELTAAFGGGYPQSTGGLAVSGSTVLLTRSPGSSAFVFERVSGGWLDQGSLQPTSGYYTPSFLSAAISGDTCVLGSSTYSGAGPAHVFTRRDGVFALATTIGVPTGAESSGFGSAVALSGNTLIVGAFAAPSQGGEAYVYTLAPGIPEVTVPVHVEGCALGGAGPGAAPEVLAALVVALCVRRARR